MTRVIISAIKCDFESTDFCGFEVTGTGDSFIFTIEQAGHIVNPGDGPGMDHLGSRNGHFAYAFSGGENNEGDQTEIETYMIHGANHKIECFSFWAAMKVRS